MIVHGHGDRVGGAAGQGVVAVRVRSRKRGSRCARMQSSLNRWLSVAVNDCMALVVVSSCAALLEP